MMINRVDWPMRDAHDFKLVCKSDPERFEQTLLEYKQSVDPATFACVSNLK